MIEEHGEGRKPYHEMSEQERLAFGKEVAEDPTCKGFMRQGRAITNVEMNAYTFYSREKKRTEKQEEGENDNAGV
jgi:hypothetical protein